MTQEIFRKLVQKRALVVPALIIITLPALLIFFLSDADYSFFEHDESLLKFSFQHPGEIKHKCTEEEIKAFREMMKLKPEHMRKAEPVCGRERFPVFVELYVDSERFLSRSYKPSGFSKDLPSYVYEIVRLKPGGHEISIKMRDSGRKEGFDGIFSERIDFEAGYVVVIDFDEVKKSFFVRH